LNLTKEQISILDHTAHRAASNLYCGDSTDMQQLINLGLMELVGQKSFVPDPYFTLTVKGKQYLEMKGLS
jgi:hypothetical protein